MHWINFPVMIVLTWSGLLLYWENSNFRIGVGNWTLIKLFPASFYEALHLTHRNDEGLAWHFLFMWVFLVNGFAYAVFLAISGQWRHIFPRQGAIKRAINVALHDLHPSKAMPPHGKYNSAQKIAYSAVALMGLLIAVTGFPLWMPDKLGWMAAPFGGLENAKAIHFWLTILFFLYFVIHVAQVVRAGWNNFRAMIIGVAVVTPGQGNTPEQGEPALPEIEMTQPELAKRTRKGFVYAGVALLAVLGAWLLARGQSQDKGVPTWLGWTQNRDESEKEREEAERLREIEEQNQGIQHK